MEYILNALGVFLWGFLIGYFWCPLWELAKKFWAEAKLAKKEWRKP